MSLLYWISIWKYSTARTWQTTHWNENSMSVVTPDKIDKRDWKIHRGSRASFNSAMIFQRQQILLNHQTNKQTNIHCVEEFSSLQRRWKNMLLNLSHPSPPFPYCEWQWKIAFVLLFLSVYNVWDLLNNRESWLKWIIVWIDGIDLI